MSYADIHDVATSNDDGDRSNLKFLLKFMLGIPLGLLMLCLACCVCGRIGYAALHAITDRIGVGGPLAAVKVGEPAPDAVLERLDGTTVSVSDYRGTPVLLVFWATWCAPCVAEIPALNATAAKHGEDELAVIAVNASDSRATVEQFVSRRDIDFTILLDPENDTRWSYRVFSVPTAILIDANGVVRDIGVGGMSQHQIEDMLAAAGSPSTQFPRYRAPGQ